MPCKRLGFSLTALLDGLSFISPAILAQAPPGPINGAQPQPPSSPSTVKPQEKSPEVQPRTSILGVWKLNRDESDDARKKMQEAREANRGSGRGSGGGGRMGGGIPGMGGGPYGGRRGGGNRESNDDRERMQDVVTPADSLSIAQKEAEVDLTEDQSRKTALFTDGRKLQKSKDLNNQQVAAHWDGNRSVTDEKSPRGGKMSRTYELSYDGRQLYETLRIPVGRSSSEVNIRYVYDQAPTATRTSHIAQ